MMKKLLLILLVLFTSLTIQAQPTYPPINSFLWGNTTVNAVGQTSFVQGAGYGFRYILPKNYNPNVKYPAIIFLHGIGEDGKDNNAQLAAGGNTANGALALVSIANPDNQTNYPCFFIAPQTPYYDWGNPVSAVQILNLIKIFEAQYPNSFDVTRIYLTGLSLGGFGTWDLPYMLAQNDYLSYNPFAAIAPMSGKIGNYTGRSYSTQPYNPTWVFHGGADPTVSITSDDANVPLLRAMGREIIYSRYTTGAHAIWPVAYQQPRLLPWLFSQKLGQLAIAPAGFPTSGLEPVNVANGINYGGLTTINFVPPLTVVPPPIIVIPPIVAATNIALNKSVTVSSNEVSTNAAANAVDGNNSTRWSSLYSDPQWIEIDLGTLYNISEIDLNWETACGKNYLIQTSPDNVNWTTQNTITSNTTTGLLKYPYVKFVSGRYVRMYGTARVTSWGYSLYEFSVYGTLPSPLNLALNSPVTVSSTDSTTNAANNAVDGILTTRWSSAYQDNQWITVDLGANHTINEIDLNWQNAAGKNYQIQTSTDNVTWTTQTNIVGNTTTGLLTYKYLTPIVGRYVKMNGLTRVTGFGFSLWEISVYGN